MNHKKGIAYIALIVCLIGMYFSGAMVAFFFGTPESGQMRSIFDNLIVPIEVWLASLLIGSWGIYELTRDK